MNFSFFLKAALALNILMATLSSDSAIAEDGSREETKLLSNQETNFICPKATERGLKLAGRYTRPFLENKLESTNLPESDEELLRPLSDEKDAMACTSLNQHYVDLINKRREGNDGEKYHLYNLSYFEVENMLVVAAEALPSSAHAVGGHHGIFTIFHDEDLNVLQWEPSFISDRIKGFLSEEIREVIEEGN